MGPAIALAVALVGWPHADRCDTSAAVDTMFGASVYLAAATFVAGIVLMAILAAAWVRGGGPFRAVVRPMVCAATSVAVSAGAFVVWGIECMGPGGLGR